MIRINLFAALKIRDVKQSEGLGSGFNFKFDFKSLDFSSPLIWRVLLPIVIIYGLNYFSDEYKKARLIEVNQTFDQINTEVATLKKELLKQQEYEQIRKQLDEDEDVIVTKLKTVRLLLENRKKTSQILISLVAALPDDLWFTDIALDTQTLKLSGAAFDFSNLSDFMKQLGRNSFFAEVTLVNSSEEKDGESKYVRFEIRLKRASDEPRKTS